MKFIKSVIQEMRKVSWPSYKQNLKDTWTVIVGSVLSAAFLGTLDWAFEAVLQHM